jgi:hypothetical protein
MEAQDGIKSSIQGTMETQGLNSCLVITPWDFTCSCLQRIKNPNYNGK